MPIYLAGNPELDKNLETMLSELSNYLTLVTGKEVSKIKTVAFAVYYTLQSLPVDRDKQQKFKIAFEENKLSDEEFIKDAIDLFKVRTSNDIKNILKKTLEEDER